MNNLLETVVNS